MAGMQVKNIQDEKGAIMPDSSGPRPRDKRDRKATEEAIVSAFETVLLRDGVQGARRRPFAPRREPARSRQQVPGHTGVG